jgi:hypothetical protein
LLPSGGPGFVTTSQNTVVYHLATGLIDIGSIGDIQVTVDPCCAVGQWNVWGLNVLADQPAGGLNGPLTCLGDLQAEPLYSLSTDIDNAVPGFILNTLVSRSANCP